MDCLLDDSVGIVSLGGRAGTGKSALALCAGLESVLERRRHRRIVVFRPLYAVGGQAPIPLDTLTTAMLGWHVLIGVGEAVITGLAVGSIVAVRPDLVHGARRVLATRPLEVRTAAKAQA